MSVFTRARSTRVVLRRAFAQRKPASLRRRSLVGFGSFPGHEPWTPLKILRELDEAETLVRELQDFRTEFTAAGHLTFNARRGKHDDLVLALAIAVWRAHGGGDWELGAVRIDASADDGRGGERTALLRRG